MSESLDMYGHKQPQLFYTDNMADKPFLESSFCDLRKDVVPIEKHGNLEPFILPSDIQICVWSGDAAINAALSTIIDQVPTEDDGSHLAVGFDSEWNFTISDMGQHERGEIAIVQIAYEKRVYILQVF
jgi:hypothetical protein